MRINIIESIDMTARKIFLIGGQVVEGRQYHMMLKNVLGQGWY